MHSSSPPFVLHSPPISINEAQLTEQVGVALTL
jgi:hypothetical protein